jgi:hypothetical protein
MKLQLDNQKLRVRINEDELARLLAGSALETCTQFGRAFAIRFELTLASQMEAVLFGEAEAWQIALPNAAVRAHAARLPTRDGLRFVLPGWSDADALELLFDVDVRDSVRQRRHRP